jgi:HAE1 family hydrophobic/amphiphilic exporter-1
MWLSDTSIRRPVTTLTLMAALVVFGWLAFTRMGVDAFPEVEFPIVTVQTVLVGASPEVMDQDVTDPIEEQIKTIGGIRQLTSASMEGFSIVTVEFELDKDIDVAAQEVRAKVALARRFLPDDIDEPIVEKFDIGGFPFMWLGVSGSVPYSELSFYAEKVLKEQLQSIKGVGNVEVGGLRKREIRVWLDPQKLEARGLTAQDVARAIQLKHVELPGGRIETPEIEYSVKVEGEYASVEELRQLVVADRGGTIITLADVGRVDDGFEDLRAIARFNGSPTVGLGIRKQPKSNLVEVADRVKARLDEIRPHLPPGISIAIAYDGSTQIKESIAGVQTDILIGILLTAAIMYLFLRTVRTTVVAVVAIPISLLGGFVVMKALDFTANNMTMLAISLAVGMVIDDAIVVIENIYRHIEMGEPPMEAARVGTAEVGLAVLAATTSIAAVFIPVAFMEGIVGRFFYQFGLTVALTILISAFVALTLTPYLSSRLMRHEVSHGRLYNLLERAFQGLERSYRRALEWAVRHRWTVMGLATAAFVAGLALVPFIGTEFITEADEGFFVVNFELPTGTSLEKTNIRMRELEERLYSNPEIASSFAAVGLQMGMGAEPNKGLFFVNLVPKKQRQASQREVMERVRGQLDIDPSMLITLETFNAFGATGRNTDISYVIQGPSTRELGELADRITAEMRAGGRFKDVDTDLRTTKPDVKVRINRGLANDLGVDVRSISGEVYALFGGNEVAKFKDGGYRYDIRIRALPEFRGRPEDLDGIAVRAESGQLIKSPNLIDYEVGTGPNSINRFDRRRSVTLFANGQGIGAGDALAEVERLVERLMPDDGRFGVALTGNAQTQRESFASLLTALVLSILIIYMVLAIQFESFIHPFTIMLSLPFTMIGVFGMLWLTGTTLNIFSFIGIIMLMGIVTKNAILLVDFANQQREKGVDKVAAILQAGPVRLRPILMTAASTMIGVVPVALALSQGGEARAPLAIAVIGGTATSTLLTLLIIPVVYLLLDDATAWVGQRFSARSRAHRPAPAPAAAPGEASNA